MRLLLPRPSELVDLAFSTAGRAVGVAAGVMALPGRVVRIVDGVEVLVARATASLDAAQQAVDDARAATERATAIVDRAVDLTQRVDAIVTHSAQTSAEAAALVTQARQTAAEAGAVVTQAGQTAATAAQLIVAYEPGLKRFVEELSPEEVDAAIRMIDELPKLAHHLNTDVLPILASLDRAGPDIHELLEVTRDLRQAIIGIPGFAVLRRRGAAEEAEREIDAAAKKAKKRM
ncbi:hypothetical protein ABZS66_47285 [Dactylosporangium sp. NPDC005572]|uniref:hypothetical protein n=1 Tax=Dactylosporangium sp. NPDC005572 TaxID=3156889 RepID=UPI0033AE2F9C